MYLSSATLPFSLHFQLLREACQFRVFLLVLKEQPRAVFPKQVQCFPNVSRHPSDLPSGLVNSQIITGPHPQISESADLRCGLKVYISNKSPWDAEVAGWAPL